MKIPEPRKLKSGAWFIQLRFTSPTGERVSVPITTATKKDCIRQAELIKAEHRSGRKTVQPASGKTLGEVVDGYIASRRAVLSPATIRGYSTMRRCRFQSLMSSPADNIDWQSTISAEAASCSAKTLKNAWGLISSALQHAGLPVPDVRLPQIVRPEIDWIPPEKIPEFLAAISGQSCEAGALLALHSLRRSELFALTWDSIDLQSGVIKVAGAVVPDEQHKFVRKLTNKTAASRRNVKIMIPRLAELLRELHASGQPIVSGSPNTLAHRITRCCELRGLPPVTTHSLRHSFASLGCALGIPEAEIASMGGWSNIATVHRIYEHYSEYQRLQAENKMELFFKKANEKANENLNPLKNKDF